MRKGICLALIIKKIVTTSILLALLCLTIFFFINANNGTNFQALADVQNTKKSTLNIPSDINFIDDDKKAFIEYCQKNAAAGNSAAIDDSTYTYYGCVGGYRFYRINVDCFPSDELNHEEMIGGYIFQSSRTFYPYSSGLYIIGDNNILTLDEASRQCLVDIGKIYALYQKAGK